MVEDQIQHMYAEMDCYTRKTVCETETQELRPLGKEGAGGGETFRILTQNVRGFSVGTRVMWLQSWKNISVKARPDCIFVQETHITSIAEAQELTHQWERMWNYIDEQHSLAFWSISKQKTGGVGILVTPRKGVQAREWKFKRWTDRIIGIEWNEWKCINIYAPSWGDKERATFYKSIEVWKLQLHSKVVFGGDFNCVEDPILDRTGPTLRRRTTESPDLSRLITAWKLQDAALAQFSAWSPEATVGFDEFTFWRGDSASRIDRFYIPEEHYTWVQQVKTRRPGVPSDHEQVELLLCDTQGKRRKARNRHFRLQYPIRGTWANQVQDEIREIIGASVKERDADAAHWEAVKGSWVAAIITVRKRTAQRRRRHAKLLEQSLFSRTTSRDQILRIAENEVACFNQVRIGKKLCRSNENIRWLFQRTATWEKDQRVKQIILQDAHTESTSDLSIPDKFAWTWKHILSSVHRQVSIKEVTKVLNELVPNWADRQVSSEENKSLMDPIEEDDIKLAIKTLERRNAGGPDGLNNDFFKDFADDITPDLMTVYNDVLQGAAPPESFLEAVIIPLKKKGESVNAMDYRPISLLQTSYKIFAKILARRLQKFLGRLIGDSQQGFVHGRRLDRAVVMMLQILKQQQDKGQQTNEDCGGILLVDFAKAYDTVDRHYLMETLASFGFSRRFISLIQALHNGTTARFLVNGQLSNPMSVTSGIRQGCPLAPLLFILAVEPLGMAMEQHPEIHGFTIQGDESRRTHTFTAFVDDSTIFFAKAEQLTTALTILDKFGKLSGLQMQPAKSHILTFGKVSQQLLTCGIPLVKEEDTVRYLGYQVGKYNLTAANWAERIRALKRRLLTATKCGTSVLERVMLFNAIAIPAIMFTAKAFEPDNLTYKELIHLQKRFIWSNQLSNERSRHKISPHLLFIPRKAGGLGLISIPVAIHTMAVKEATMWLLEPTDRYTQAWRNWCKLLRPDGTNVWISPCRANSRRITRGRGKKISTVQHHLSRFLGPTPEDMRLLQRYVSSNFANLQSKCSTQLSTSTKTLKPGDHIQVYAEVESIEWHEMGSPALRAFWGTFAWHDNPWITDAKAEVLSEGKYARIPSVKIRDLHIKKVAQATFRWTVQGSGEMSHSRRKIGRWLLCIILCSPRVEIGEEVGAAGKFQLLSSQDQWEEVTWRSGMKRCIMGTNKQTGQQWSFRQREDGIYWDEIKATQRGQARSSMQQSTAVGHRTTGLVFAAHPDLHNYPWTVQNGVQFQSVKRWIRRTFRKAYYQAMTIAGAHIRDRWCQRRDESGWNANVQEQSPIELWRHDNMLSDYQLWSIYRTATFQLNVYYDGYNSQGGCILDDQCRTPGKGVTHIVWGCSRAKQLWARLITCWNGRRLDEADLEHYRRSIARRRAPPLSASLTRRLKERCGKRAEECKEAVERLWRGMCSLGITWLWIFRNEAVHKGVRRGAREQLELIWSKITKQLLAVAYYERKRAVSRVRGIRLQIGLECLQDEVLDRSSDDHKKHFPDMQDMLSSGPTQGLDFALGEFIVANS